VVEQEPLAAALLAAMSESVYVVSRDRTITYWNPAAEALTGYSAGEVVGRRCHDGLLNHVDDDGAPLCTTRCPLSATMLDGLPREASLHLHHSDGHRVPVSVRAAPLRGDDGAIVGAVEVFHDDSRYRALEASSLVSEQRSLTDPLTGLANRRRIQGHLNRRWDEFCRYGHGFAVLFVDIDDFKVVNDRFGHTVGDEVLTMVASTMMSCTRPSDDVGRWGGEEFLVVAGELDGSSAFALAERLRSLVGSSWTRVGEDTVRVTASVGVAVARPDESVGQLVSRADHAMLEAKRSGRDRTVVA
jgi:diguanylate cyclase (GGDEF)-like protein/PAS domain S-box-containing protein